MPLDAKSPVQSSTLRGRCARMIQVVESIPQITYGFSTTDVNVTVALKELEEAVVFARANGVVASLTLLFGTGVEVTVDDPKDRRARIVELCRSMIDLEPFAGEVSQKKWRAIASELAVELGREL